MSPAPAPSSQVLSCNMELRNDNNNERSSRTTEESRPPITTTTTMPMTMMMSLVPDLQHDQSFRSRYSNVGNRTKNEHLMDILSAVLDVIDDDDNDASANSPEDL